MVADGRVGETGVDEQFAAVLHHDAGALAVVTGGLRAALPSTVRLTASERWLRLPGPMHYSTYVEVGDPAGGRERIDASFDGEGLRYQAVEVHRCLRAGLTESPVMPLDETCSIAGTLDAVRAGIGMTYPGE